MAELYELLATLHRTRVEVANQWLEDNKRIVVAPTPYLRPHTPEWFTALEIWDPPKAAMTRIAIECAGSPDVCSVCGGRPLGATFDWKHPQRPAQRR